MKISLAEKRPNNALVLEDSSIVVYNDAHGNTYSNAEVGGSVRKMTAESGFVHWLEVLYTQVIGAGQAGAAYNAKAADEARNEKPDKGFSERRKAAFAEAEEFAKKHGGTTLSTVLVVEVPLTPETIYAGDPTMGWLYVPAKGYSVMPEQGGERVEIPTKRNATDGSYILPKPEQWLSDKEVATLLKGKTQTKK